MKAGRHAAGDGSFGRSAGGAAFRGAILLAVAVLLGTVLLQATDDEGDPFTQGAGGAQSTTTTTAQPGDPTGTTVAPAGVRPPAEVKVIALNASGVGGVARKASDALTRAGYQVLPAGNANARAQASAVFFTPGFEAEARELARGLGLAPTAAQALPTPAPANDLKGANVVVVIGPDLAEQLNAPPSTTTTTAAG